MKKLIVAVVAVVFSSAVFAQTERKSKPPIAGTEMKMDDMTHCYAMKDGAMVHCMGDKTEKMKKDVILKNGTVVTTKGDITMKGGKKIKLTNGQCIDVNGKVGDFVKMHADMKKGKM